LRRACKEAWQLASLPKHVSPRTLRQIFSGCLLDKSVDQRVVQAILGRSAIGVPAKIELKASPLDQLLVGTRRRARKKIEAPQPEPV
jgi:site-specific recombinase XerC